MIKLLLIIVFYSCLTACGAKGDLFLPAEKEKPQDPVSTSAIVDNKQTDSIPNTKGNVPVFKNSPEQQEL